MYMSKTSRSGETVLSVLHDLDADGPSIIVSLTECLWLSRVFLNGEPFTGLVYHNNQTLFAFPICLTHTIRTTRQNKLSSNHR